MLTDDDQDDRFLFSRAVKDCCPTAECYLAGNGEKALEILKNSQKDKPDVIFLDINMPGMGGWQCLDAIKRDDKLKGIPVIMYSTSSHENDISKALEKGAECFCIKPEDFDDLKKVIRFIGENLDNSLKNALGENTHLKFLKC